jgi:hypothetical protein
MKAHLIKKLFIQLNGIFTERNFFTSYSYSSRFLGIDYEYEYENRPAKTGLSSD